MMESAAEGTFGRFTEATLEDLTSEQRTPGSSRCSAMGA